MIPKRSFIIIKRSFMKHLQSVSEIVPCADDKLIIWKILMQEWAVMWWPDQMFLDIMGKVHATEMKNYVSPSVLNIR